MEPTWFRVSDGKPCVVGTALGAQSVLELCSPRLISYRLTPLQAQDIEDQG